MGAAGRSAAPNTSPGASDSLKINLLQRFPSPPGVWLRSRCVRVPGPSGPRGGSSAGVVAWSHACFLVSQSQRLENSPGCASAHLIGQRGRGERGRDGSHSAFLWVKLFKSN